MEQKFLLWSPLTGASVAWLSMEVTTVEVAGGIENDIAGRRFKDGRIGGAPQRPHQARCCHVSLKSDLQSPV